MNIETAHEVSKLLEEKIKYERDLERLLSKDYDFNLCAKYINSISPFPCNLNINEKKDFIEKIKILTIIEVESKIIEITKSIENLKS